MAPTTDKCCCCFTLRQGAIIIGALGVCGAIIGMSRKSQASDDTEIAIDEYLAEHTGLLYLTKFLFVVGGVLSIALLIGSIMNNRSLVWVYVVGSICSLVIQVPLTTFLCLAVEEYVGLIAIPFFLLPAYFIWVAYSFHKDLEARLP